MIPAVTTDHSACNMTLHSLTPLNSVGPCRQELVDLPGVVLNVVPRANHLKSTKSNTKSFVFEMEQASARHSCGGNLAMRVQLRIQAVIIQQLQPRLRGALAGEQYDAEGVRLWSDAEQDRL